MNGQQNSKNGGLLKIGELAKEAGVRPSTIRYYTAIGLLIPAEITPSGYRLYERDFTLERIRFIRSVVNGKPTLRTLREKLNK